MLVSAESYEDKHEKLKINELDCIDLDSVTTE